MLLNDMAYIIAIAIEILLPIILAIIIWKKFKGLMCNFLFWENAFYFLLKLHGRAAKFSFSMQSGNIIQSKYTQAQNQTQLE